jgi:polygalacturonase
MKILKPMKFQFLFLLILSAQFSVAQLKTAVSIQKIIVKTPFGDCPVNVPDFSKTAQLNILDFGAKSDDQEKTSLAIAKAITRANELGGGRVIVPAGEWSTGKIHLKSNVNLHLEKDAVLLFSGNPDDYLPAVHSTWEGMECMNYSPLIYAYACKNVAITGEGTLKAKMEIWKTWFSRPKPHMESIKRLYNLASVYAPMSEREMVNDTAHMRPQFIQFNRCENVLLEGVNIVNSPFWTIHPYLSKHITIRRINVYAHGHNNDGVDPEMSQNVLIENCVFDQGDDAIAIKSGRNPEGWRLKVPSRKIIIRNCLVKNGHQLLALGSELSGGIEDVLIEDCEVVDGSKLDHLIFIKTNERMGGYVRNIFARRITAGRIELGILGIDTDVLYQWRTLVPTTLVKLTPISNVFLENIKVTKSQFVSRIAGVKSLPVKNVTLKNVSALAVGDNPVRLKNVEGFKIDN